MAWLGELGLRHIEVSDGTLDARDARKCEIISQPREGVSPCSRRWAARTPPTSWRHIAGSNRSKRSWRREPQGHHGGARVRDRGHLPRGRRGAHRPDRRDRARRGPGHADLRGTAQGAAGLVPAAVRPECNLGNIAPNDVLSLETLRLGLRAETVERFARDGARDGHRGGVRRGAASGAAGTSYGRSHRARRPALREPPPEVRRAAAAPSSRRSCWPRSAACSWRSGSSTPPRACRASACTALVRLARAWRAGTEQISFRTAKAD